MMAHNIKNKGYEICIQLLLVFYIILALIAELELVKGIKISQYHLIVAGFIFVIVSTRGKILFSVEPYIDRSYIYLGILLLFILINSIFVRQELLTGALFNLFLGAIAGEYLGKSKYSSKIILLPFWLLIIFIVIRLLSNPDPNAVFMRSRNYISFFLIITVLPYYFTRLKLRQTFSTVPAIITFALSVYSLGRSGILSSMILLLAVILGLNLKKSTFRLVSLVSILVFPTMVVYFLNNYASINDIRRIVEIAEWSNMGGRTSFWLNYLENSNFLTFFFGMDINTNAILDIGGSYLPGHVHSSILNFISVGGVAALVFLGVITFRMIRSYSINLSIFLLAIALFVRIFTETGCLFGYFDYVIWMFLFVKT